ncbi:YdcF family protein [Pseudonocardia sp. ICBG1293]|uniref:YdcF family protein n=1 Tax=Pseudonocardia sp. ICBG1293 TaxID=2844382 RepID=UPI001CCC745D|nr:YdcF family protein [Pseudonocardia sp. ICBG1293]
MTAAGVLVALAALSAALCVVGVLVERRRFRNAVAGGTAVVLLLMALIAELPRFDVGVVDLATALVAALLGVFVLVLTGFLLVNGIVMTRREGRRPANLLSLLAGLACLAVVVLVPLTLRLENRFLTTVTYVTLLLAAYLGFLLCSLLAYAVVYRSVGFRPGVDFVVVLGSGLVRGVVPPLLASRLDRAAALWERERERGGDPMLVTSGGRGPDEPVAEAVAMADHLVARGVPSERILREDRSRTTRENLVFSLALMAERVPDPRCAVVTNDFHAFRAALTARRAGVDGQVVGSPTARYYRPSATLREFVAILAEHRALNATIGIALVVLGVVVGLDR